MTYNNPISLRPSDQDQENFILIQRFMTERLNKRARPSDVVSFALEWTANALRESTNLDQDENDLGDFIEST